MDPGNEIDDRRAGLDRRPFQKPGRPTMAVSRSGRCRPIPADRRAGYLVEKLSGMGFGEFLRTRLFEPLGMRDTAFWVPSDKNVCSLRRRDARSKLARAAGLLPLRSPAGRYGGERD
jgi:hypothetical protein